MELAAADSLPPPPERTVRWANGRQNAYRTAATGLLCDLAFADPVIDPGELEDEGEDEGEEAEAEEDSASVVSSICDSDASDLDQCFPVGALVMLSNAYMAEHPGEPSWALSPGAAGRVAMDVTADVDRPYGVHAVEDALGEGGPAVGQICEWFARREITRYPVSEGAVGRIMDCHAIEVLIRITVAFCSRIHILIRIEKVIFDDRALMPRCRASG